MNDGCIVAVLNEPFSAKSQQAEILLNSFQFVRVAVWAHRLELQLTSAHRTELDFDRVQGEIPIIHTGSKPAGVHQPKTVVAISEICSRL